MCIQIYVHLWMQIYIHMCICIYIHIYIYMYIHVLSHFSHVQFFATLWTVAHQTPLSMGFSRQEYWNVLPCSPPGGIASMQESNLHLMSLALTGIFFTTSTTWEVQYIHTYIYTHTYVCMYIYIEREREREREREYT